MYAVDIFDKREKLCDIVVCHRDYAGEELVFPHACPR